MLLCISNPQPLYDIHNHSTIIFDLVDFIHIDEWLLDITIKCISSCIDCHI